MASHFYVFERCKGNFFACWDLIRNSKPYTPSDYFPFANLRTTFVQVCRCRFLKPPIFPWWIYHDWLKIHVVSSKQVCISSAFAKSISKILLVNLDDGWWYFLKFHENFIVWYSTDIMFLHGCIQSRFRDVNFAIGDVLRVCRGANVMIYSHFVIASKCHTASPNKFRWTAVAAQKISVYSSFLKVQIFIEHWALASRRVSPLLKLPFVSHVITILDIVCIFRHC